MRKIKQHPNKNVLNEMIHGDGILEEFRERLLSENEYFSLKLAV